jgi:hypothetical protein
LLAACSGSSSSPLPGLDPYLQLEPTGQGNYSSHHGDQLDEVSNNGLGYTGEIDHFAIQTPEPGRLQLSLTWEHSADIDLVVAADPEGNQRLVEGITNGYEPEYVGLDVARGQTIHIFVAGWSGDPGEYELETILLPLSSPKFDLDEAPDFTDLWPANRPLTFKFTVPLDPDQDFAERTFFVCQGRVVEGEWCAAGDTLTFYPRLPQLPGDAGGIDIGRLHTVQFPRAARGLRAETGEYLDVLATGEFVAGPYEDPDPAGPPCVMAVNPPPGAVWNGEPVVLEISEPLDPLTLTPLMFEVGAGGVERPIAFRFTLEQRYDCDGAAIVRLSVTPDEALAPGSTLRLMVPGTTLGISGADVTENSLTGPPPFALGAGYAVDFTVP